MVINHFSRIVWIKFGVCMNTIRNEENTEHLASRERSARDAGQNATNTGRLVYTGRLATLALILSAETREAVFQNIAQTFET